MCFMQAAQMAVQSGQNIAGSVALKKQGDAQYKDAQYQARVSRNNAIVSAAQGRDAQERGEQEQAQYARQTANMQGRQRAQAAGSGLLTGEGSMLEQIAEGAGLIHQDAENMRRSTERERLGFVNQQNQFIHQADMALARGEHARKLGRKALTMTLIDPFFDWTKPMFTGQAQDNSQKLALIGQMAGQMGGGGQQPVRVNPQAAAYFNFKPQNFQNAIRW
jgi:hypothetical protein